MSAHPAPLRDASPEVAQQDFIITISARRKNLVPAVLRHLLDTECTLTEHQHHTEGGRDFARIEFTTQQPIHRDELRANLLTTIEQLTSADWQVHVVGQKVRSVVMVSKLGHCLNDLLFRARHPWFPIQVAAVVSNHPDLRGLAASYGVPFHHIPVTTSTKQESEAALLRLVDEADVQLVVLARYMQVLSGELCNLLPGKIINIHHALLPSFPGARPYHQAYARGVKLVGATAHYATGELDQGPIIGQQAEAIDHRMTPERLVALGQDIEARTLAQAVQWHGEHRVMLYSRRTVIFS